MPRGGRHDAQERSQEGYCGGWPHKGVSPGPSGGARARHRRHGVSSGEIVCQGPSCGDGTASERDGDRSGRRRQATVKGLRGDRWRCSRSSPDSAHLSQIWASAEERRPEAEIAAELPSELMLKLFHAGFEFLTDFLNAIRVQCLREAPGISD